MAAQNRDQERLYVPGKLSYHFAIWSTLLLLVMVWMLVQDHYRPWKDYQRAYREREIQLNIQKRKNVETRLGGAATLEALLAEEAAAQKALAGLAAQHPELPGLEKELVGLGHALKVAEDHEKEIKGVHAPARYQYELALEHLKVGKASVAEVEARRETLNKLSTEWLHAVDAYKTAQANYDAVNRKIQAIRGPALAAVKAVERKLLGYRGRQAAVLGLEQKYVNNQWRNAPVIDFIARSLEVRQVVLKDIHDNWNFASSPKVDRCITCHVGIDQPDMSDERIGQIFASEIAQAYGVADPYPTPGSEEAAASSAPPSAAALAEFDVVVEKFKTQHGFEGWMQPHPGLDLIAGPSSPHRVETVGCSVCHHGVGWSTDFSRAAHAASSPEQLERWKADRDWKKPEFVDFPMLAREYVQGMCFKCHKQGFGWPTPYVETLTHGWVKQRHEVAGRGEVELPPFDSFGKLQLPPAPGAVEGSRSEVLRVRRLAEMFRLRNTDFDEDNPDPGAKDANQYDGLVTKPQGYDWEATAYDKGEETIVRYGCQGCHKIKDFGDQVSFDGPPRVGPNLGYLADKVTLGWLERWIKHPDAYRIDTRMPSFFWFVPKNGDWQPVGADGKPLADGRLAPVPVMDSHLFDRDAHVRGLGQLSAPDDIVRMNIQVACMAAYLMSQQDKERPGRLRSRANPDDPEFNALYAEDPLPGDWEKGRETAEAYGCVACHVVPEVKDAAGEWVADTGARFQGEPAKAPRITSLGSKLKDARWLNAWLARPRHYTATTSMPFMRWKDQTASDGTVLRTADQVRADVVAYLLRYKDERFEALAGAGWDESWQAKFKDMYEEYFGREAGNLRRPSEVDGELEGLGAQARVMVGEKLMARNGCFGCHEVKGHEADQPIGTELTKEGIKDLHQLEFAMVHVVPHTRTGFFRTKITHPRIWDHGRVRRWTDQLKMPRFNFRMDDGQEGVVATRGAVAGIVLGLVEEPIQEGALYRPSEAARDLIRFRRVVERYGCNNCHPLEGQMSVMWRYLGAPREFAPGETPEDYLPSASFDLKFSVPPLFAQGERTQAGWLLNFLQDPQNLRPNVRQRMPKFELNVEEADALVAGFQRLAGIELRNRYQPESSLAGRDYAKPLDLVVTDDQGKVTDSRPIRGAVEEAEFLFDTINCNKCHLPKGTPGSDLTDGGVAPPFQLAARRLGRDWVIALLNDPQHVIRGTGMVSPWGRSGYGRSMDAKYLAFQLELREDPEWQRLWAACEQGKKRGPEKDEAMRRLAEVQRSALADYVLHHYRWPRQQPAEPR